MTRALFLFLLGGSLGLALSAQTPSEEPARLEPLVVTAQKRGQSIESVPASLTAYSGTALAALGIDSFDALAPLVPGLFVSTQSPSYPSLNVRGVGTDSNDPRQEPRVSVFLDGVAIGRTAGASVALFDLAQVEVLKGPQGTLFGRHAGSGALSLVTARPAATDSARLALGGGDAGQRRATGFVNTASPDARLSARVAFLFDRADGATPNLAGGPALGGRDTVALRPSLRRQPQPDTTIDLILGYERDTASGTAFKSGVIPTSRGDTDPFTAAELNRGAALGGTRELHSATLSLSHRLAPRWTLVSLTSARRFTAHDESDIDGSRLFLLEAGDHQTGRELSQELRLNFDDDQRLAGFLGLSATRERAAETVDLATDERQLWPFLAGNFRSGLLAAGVPATLVDAAVPPLHPFLPQTNLPAGFAALAFVPPLAPLATLAGAPLRPLAADRYRNDAAFDAVDFFADGTWRATERLELTAGLRLTLEHQTTGYEAPADAVPSTLGFLLGATPNFAIAPTAGRLTDSARSTGWVGRLAARYLATPRASLYATLSRGRRPPALIITSTDRTRAREESIVNAELGAKGQSADARYRWSLAAFAYRYRHFQTSVQDPANLARFVTLDAGSATGRGAEASLTAQLNGACALFATYGYTDATFDDRADNGIAQQFAGSTFRLTSRHTAALGASWTAPFARGRFTFAPRLEYRSAHFFDDDNTRSGGTLRQPGGALLHARASWTSADRRWEITGSVRNALDRATRIDAGNTGASFGIPTFVRGEPRRLAFEVTRTW
ncbi:MAG: TonB-dependent receptor [Candidatus Didemnitutus sp.]|nr:TonB-dependent receptor [Candidatus Didemnitutus sp.]